LGRLKESLGKFSKGRADEKAIGGGKDRLAKPGRALRGREAHIFQGSCSKKKWYRWFIGAEVGLKINRKRVGYPFGKRFKKGGPF